MVHGLKKELSSEAESPEIQKTSAPPHRYLNFLRYISGIVRRVLIFIPRSSSGFGGRDFYRLVIRM